MTTDARGKYIYCIVRDEAHGDVASPGIDGSPVELISEGDLTAVVSDSPLIEYESSRRNMLAHTRIIEEVMGRQTALPVCFSTIAPSVEALLRLMQRRRGEFVGLLAGLDGRAELGIKALWADDGVYQELLAEHATIRELRDSLADKNPIESHYERIRLGELVETAMRRKRIDDGELILQALKPLAQKTRTNKLISERMVLNTAFLIDRSREHEFDRTIADLDAAMGARIKFKYVGPVPPYNFVNIVVRWDEDS